ncbi:MAG: Tol-Pal system protein TolB, partial [Proteobacteria bacterium]
MLAPLPRRRVLGLVSSLPLLTWPLTEARAQFRVEVSGVGLTQYPISAVGFRGNDVASENIAAIVRADLER